MGSRNSFARRTGQGLPVVVAILVLAAGCQAMVEATSATGPTLGWSSAATTSNSRVEPILVAFEDPPPRPDQDRTFRDAFSEDIASDNTLCGEPRGTGMPVADTRPSLYTVAMPGVNVVPDLAVPVEPPEPQLEGGEWVVEVPLREDAAWSDGHPITADDIVFTFDLAGQPWGGCLNWDWHTGVSAIEAINEHTVRITFAGEPGLKVWPHIIGIAGIKAEHFWATHIAAAREEAQVAVDAIDDPATAAWETRTGPATTAEGITQDQIDAFLAGVYNVAIGDYLQSVSGIGEPSGGPLVFADWTPGISITYLANPRYYRSGEVVTSGGVSYEIGPFIDEYKASIYGSDQETALALMNGEVDAAYLSPNPALQILLERNPDTVHYKNPSDVLWYLGFNLRKPPMSDLAFRQALAVMIDRDFLAHEVFQGGVQPTWTVLPEANLQWFDPVLAAGIASKYRDLDPLERVEKAVAILDAAGYTWERRPSVGQDERGELVVEPGSGITMPDGTPAPHLQILAFGSGSTGYFWFTSYSVYVEHWLTDLGFTARAVSSTGPLLVSEVWPGIGVEPTFDLYLLGWGGDNPAFPTLAADVFHSRNLAEVNDGNNAVGYVNPEFDELADTLYQVTAVDEARQIMWQLEAMIGRDLPYVVLHHLFVPSAYRTRVRLPFTEQLVFWNPELPTLVRIEE